MWTMWTTTSEEVKLRSVMACSRIPGVYPYTYIHTYNNQRIMVHMVHIARNPHEHSL